MLSGSLYISGVNGFIFLVPTALIIEVVVAVSRPTERGCQGNAPERLCMFPVGLLRPIRAVLFSFV